VNLKFLPGSDRIVKQLAETESFDATIMVDVAQADRVGKLFVQCKEKGKLVCIDHHLNIPDGFDVKCLDGGAASTGDVIYRRPQASGAADHERYCDFDLLHASR
jgi:nanoRNase/pAp phosphatase (c-di-AMP/oligoRNAs hydrolase)